MPRLRLVWRMTLVVIAYCSSIIFEGINLPNVSFNYTNARQLKDES